MLDRINADFNSTGTAFSNSVDTTNLPRHRWYYYKEGFSPDLVEKAIQESGVGSNDLIIDPFNGSGTTTLTASLGGYRSIGIEVNPFTSFLANAKVQNVNFGELNQWTGKLLKSVEMGLRSPLLGYSTFSKRDGLDKWLFNDSILNCFEGGWGITQSVKSRNTRKLLQLALITTAMKNCNATRDGKCLRYRDSWSHYKFNKDSFVETLTRNITDIANDIKEQPVTQKAEFVNGDCRKVLSSKNLNEPFKLCITSPPYLNTFDYTDIYRPELFLGKFIKDGVHLRELRLKTVRSHIQAKWKAPVSDDFGLSYHQAMDHVNANRNNLMSKDIPLMIQAYFEDMLHILKLLKNKAAKDAQIWFVVSNSAYADLEVPVDLIIGDIASKAGWYLKEIGVLRYLQKRKTNYSKNVKELRESVIILSSTKF